jgi:predicted aspartyl protease
LEKRGKLLLSKAAVGGTNGQASVLRLLLDTGSSYTMLPVEVLEALGYDTHRPLQRTRMVTASGIIVAPVVRVSWFHCLGQRVEDFAVAAYTLPPGVFVDGLLGMDFLLHCQAVIAVESGAIHFEE